MRVRDYAYQHVVSHLLFFSLSNKGFLYFFLSSACSGVTKDLKVN
jgi:hypothetical protein